ncbi:hypothetical protein EMPS_05212 [Entomortierella parvispora]|uniref:Uncharacterized protein n=1 Tax=Entomortierella parvispora TaxID=205924 RepID=A0A9P3H9X2_9FUNG|nr:hypothetical protein EMPS_05212 [Entomortierella parvispora]
MSFVNNPNDIPNVYPPVFDPSQTDEIQDYLKAEGYVAVQVTSAAEAQARYSEFWTFLENLGSGISRNDPSTWNLASTWPQQMHGIVFGFGVGQAEFAWKARIEPNVVQTFANVWEVPATKLLTSFDGANMIPNPRYAHNAVGEGESELETRTVQIPYGHGDGEEGRSVEVKIAAASPASLHPASVKIGADKLGLVHTTGRYQMWPHRDQKPSRQDRICIQGLYSMLPNTGPGDGGLVVYPRTHTIDWTERDEKAKTSDDWYRIRSTFAEVDPKNAAVLRTPAGCLLLWDSRLIHCNRPPTADGRTRAVSYICMLPRGSAPKSELLQRQKAYTNFKTSTHWPYPLQVNDEDHTLQSNASKKKSPVKSSPFGMDNPAVRSLVGYEERSIMSMFEK